MLTFLDLPRELRDMVYEHALTCVDAIAVPVLQERCPSSQPTDARKKSKRQSSHRLFLLPAPPAYLLPSSAISKVAQGPHHEALATALPLANRQTYVETNDLAWERNTLAFETPSVAVRVLNAIGQDMSARIRHVDLYVSKDSCEMGHDLRQALGMLASYARRGALASVRLIIEGQPRAVDELRKRLQFNARAGWGNARRSMVVQVDSDWMARQWARNPAIDSSIRRWKKDAALDMQAWGLDTLTITDGESAAACTTADLLPECEKVEELLRRHRSSAGPEWQSRLMGCYKVEKVVEHDQIFAVNSPLMSPS